MERHVPMHREPYQGPVPIHYGFVIVVGLVILWGLAFWGLGYWMGCR
jgi:hypothetical protein